MENTDQNERQWALSLMARSPESRVQQLFDARCWRLDFDWLRQPEVGSVMVRGRAGGTGNPFNLGEMTITRCTLRLKTGEVGHAYIQGRRKADAEVIACSMPCYKPITPIKCAITFSNH